MDTYGFFPGPSGALKRQSEAGLDASLSLSIYKVFAGRLSMSTRIIERRRAIYLSCCPWVFGLADASKQRRKWIDTDSQAAA